MFVFFRCCLCCSFFGICEAVVGIIMILIVIVVVIIIIKIVIPSILTINITNRIVIIKTL